jgi:hypothetical protein
MPDENQRLKDSSDQAGCRGGCHGNQPDEKINRRVAIGCMFLFASSVDIFAMSNRYHPNRNFFILNRIDYSVMTVADAISFLSCEFFVAWRPRVTCESLNAKDDFL